MNKNKLSRMFQKSSTFYIVLAVIAGFVTGAVLLTAIGVSPVAAYGRLIKGVFGKPKYLTWSVVYAAPLILTGLSVAFSFKTGVFNIGAEGQFIVGSMAAAITGICLDLPPVLHAIVCAVASMVAGALWGSIVAVLKVKRGIHEVLSYIMFNWIAYYLSNYLVNTKALHSEGNAEATRDIKASATILCPDFIISLTNCKKANWGIVIAILTAVLVWFVISRTTLGFQFRAVGFNKYAAEYGGIHSGKTIIKAMAVSGAIAGLGGMVQLCGMSFRISQFAGQEGFGFEGITVALIAAAHPIGCIFSGLFYGMLKYSGTKLTLIKVPGEVIDIIMGVIVFFIAIAHIFRQLLSRKRGVK